MKRFLCVTTVLASCLAAFADTHYVNATNGSPVEPYISWATAANRIQDAVDFSSAGDIVLVTNGVYTTGGAVTPGYACSNRVVITNDISVQSVNGPETTFIVGAETTRGVYMSAGTLSGFTITNGHVWLFGWENHDLSGGGINMRGGDGVVSNCILTGNSASDGGGSAFGTLNNCTLSGNSSSGLGRGGGSYNGTLNNCVISDNSAYDDGGGSAYSTLNNCTLTGNSAGGSGGGSFNDTLHNCALSGNMAQYGGGSYFGTLNNCTLTGNSAGDSGGGSYAGTLNNCIVYYNMAPSDANRAAGSFSYSCTTPLYGGTGNMTNAPLLLSASHIRADSPCVGAGSAAYASGTDIDGETWLSPPSMGCDEALAPFVGELSVSIAAEHAIVATGYALALIAEISGEVASNRWMFGDGTSLPNTVYAEHAWAAPGSYEVVLTAYNDDCPGGVSATAQVQVVANSSYYVDVGNASPVSPYTSWDTAATNIQEAIEAMAVGSTGTVWVTNGVYNTGGAVTPGDYNACMNRVVITNDITVQSVNGPEETFIVGEGPLGSSAVRGVYMSAGTLSGFTITNGHTCTSGDDRHGGGINMSGGDGVVSNCTLSGNSADSSGGGSYYGTLNNCTLSGNSVTINGGGSSMSTLNNCTLTGNSSSWRGGGSYYGTLNNCIIYFNTAINSGDNWYSDTPDLAYCCTTPDPGGTGNITNNPLFFDASNGNYHLQADSLCIDAGNNADAPGPIDLDGNPRVVNIVDMGAYEYIHSAEDYDGDEIRNDDEQIADTDPLDSSDFFHIAAVSNLPSYTVYFNSSTSRSYTLLGSTNLPGGIWTNIPGAGPRLGQGADSMVDSNGSAATFYRMEVSLP